MSCLRNISCLHPASLAECSLFSTILQTCDVRIWWQNEKTGYCVARGVQGGWWRQLQTEQTLALAFPGTEWWGANIWNMESRVPSPLITCPCFYSLAFISSAYHLLPSLGSPTRAGSSSYISVTIIYKPSSSFSSAPFLFSLVPGFRNLFSF
jgi:hypothetical protein